MCGYNAAYGGNHGIGSDSALQDLPRREHRLLLSRDAALIEPTTTGLLLTEHDVADQLDELRATGFELYLPEHPRGCGHCKGPLEPMPANAERPEYVPSPAALESWRCVDCSQ
jgi:uncharacterized protein with PIN domain